MSRPAASMKRVVSVEHDTLHPDLIREWLEEGGVQAAHADSPAPLAADVGAFLVDVSCDRQAFTTLDAVARDLQ